jgi:hypothetical protein
MNAFAWQLIASASLFTLQLLLCWVGQAAVGAQAMNGNSGNEQSTLPTTAVAAA